MLGVDTHPLDVQNPIRVDTQAHDDRVPQPRLYERVGKPFVDARVHENTGARKELVHIRRTSVSQELEIGGGLDALHELHGPLRVGRRAPLPT